MFLRAIPYFYSRLIRVIPAAGAAVGLIVSAVCTPVPPIDPLGSAQHHTQVGKHFYLAGEYPKAEKEFRRALELYPQSEVAAEYLAVLLYRRDRLLQAEEMAGRAIELNPGSGRAYLVLAGCLHRQGRSKEALGTVRRALTLLRRKDERERAQALIEEIQAAVDGTAPERDGFKRALGYFRAENWDSAAVLLEAVMAKAPRDSAAGELVALLRLRDHRFDEAVVAANGILNRHPRSAAAHFVLGMRRKLMDDTLNARPLLKKADDLANPHMRALFEKFRDLPPAPADTAAAPPPVVTAIMPFGSTGGSPEDTLCRTVRRMLSAAMVKSGRFSVVAPARTDSLLGPTRDGVDPETALDAGARLGCGAVLTGACGAAGGVYEADVRLIDVNTAQALGAAGGSSVGPEGLVRMAESITLRLVEQLR